MKVDEHLPKAAILLSVRGNDPFLANCVEGLLRQDYPEYTVSIVVDHIEDPAWEVIQGVTQRFPNNAVKVEPLRDRFGTCTLKVNSLVQAATALDKSYEVIAILDADVAPHPTWLRELVAPFQDERVFATTGNRWYMPEQVTMASLVRYAWNSGAAVQMYLSRCTWGGSMAFRARLLRDTDLQERWRHAIASDTALDEAIRSAGGKVVFLPSLMSLNRESCTFPSLWRFVRRQLLHSRLKGSDWPLIFIHGMCGTLIPLFAFGLSVWACAVGDWRTAAIAGGGLVSYGFVLFALLWLLESSVSKAARARGAPTRWLTPKAILRLMLAVPLTQLLYTAVLPTLRFIHEFSWRGVDYRIEGRNVKLIRYQAYGSDKRPANESIT